MVIADRSHALETLYREDGARLWRSLLAFMGDPDVASDAVAEAYAQAIRRGEAIRDPKAWIAVRVHLSRGRARLKGLLGDEND